jgi:hypothetical protein
VTDIACWITFFADGAMRNSSRSDLYSRFGDAGLLRADAMISLLGHMYGIYPYLTRATGENFLAHPGVVVA